MYVRVCVNGWQYYFTTGVLRLLLLWEEKMEDEHSVLRSAISGIFCNVGSRWLRVGRSNHPITAPEMVCR